MTIVSKSFIDKQYTNAIKGFALVLMFIHHFFCFPDRLVTNIEYEHIDTFASIFHDPTNICVCIFAFLTGYFYYFNKNKTIRYSIKKSTDIYINYLFVFGLMLLLDYFLGCYKPTGKSLLLELLIIDKPNMEFCWYVLFYIMAIFILPFFARIAEKSSVFAFAIGLILPSLIVFVLNGIKNSFDIGSLDSIFDVIKYLGWFPSVASGYLFAKKELFQNLDLISGKNILTKVIISVLFIVVPMFARSANASFDFIYAPIMIYGLITIFDLIRFKKVLFPLSIIGKYSLLMWFIHSVFFNVSKEYTQPVLYYPHNPVLVLLWGLFLSLAISFIVSYPINLINKIKNKLFKL